MRIYIYILSSVHPAARLPFISSASHPPFPASLHPPTRVFSITSLSHPRIFHHFTQPPAYFPSLSHPRMFHHFTQPPTYFPSLHPATRLPLHHFSSPNRPPSPASVHPTARLPLHQFTQPTLNQLSFIPVTDICGFQSGTHVYL